MARHRHVVVYDISSDAIRNRVADVLEGYGERVQFSVFECRLDRGALESLTEALRRALATPENGSIRVYRLCQSCEARAFGLGQVEQEDDEPFRWA